MAHKEIHLSNGKVTLVDEADYERCLTKRWHHTTAGRKIGYAYFTNKVEGHNYMHRWLLNAPKGVNVDHIDGDTLNNRRSNLRLASTGQNNRNVAPRAGTKSGYKGVFPDHHKWKAKIMVDRKMIYLGSFPTAEAAALAYNKAALEHHGEFACLNVIPTHL